MNRATWRASAAITTIAITAGLVLVTAPAADARRALAKTTLLNAAGEEVGTVVFRGHGAHADRVDVVLDLPDNAPGLGTFHGFHIHTVGKCTNGFADAAGHWNTNAGATHGNHTGDLPSILVGTDGRATARSDTPRFNVNDLFDGDGSAVILHAGIDNFGNVPREAAKYQDPNNWYTAPTGTGATGDAGARYACGVVEPT